MAGRTLQVVAGALLRDDGCVLLDQRPPGKQLAGCWEFPGGKREPGESASAALRRELHEELGIEALSFAPLISIPWRHGAQALRLEVLRVIEWRGEPSGCEGQRIDWFAPARIDRDTLAGADRIALTALRLPPHYVITPPGASAEAVLAAFDTALPPPAHADGGQCPPYQPAADGANRGVGAGKCRAGTARRVMYALQLRLPARERATIRALAGALAPRCAAAGVPLLLNHDIELARELGLGVHLRAAQLRALASRPIPRDCWLGASCHDADELALAQAIGCDFATLSPVAPTASHPTATPLGWQRFAALVADAALPVYALGGLGPADLNRALAAGAQGVAGITGFM